MLRSVSDEVNIQAEDPFGSFGWLEEVDLFEKMADAAPTGWFSATIFGFIGEMVQSAFAVLEDGLLCVEYEYGCHKVCIALKFIVFD